jgi:hypothetical protein
MSYRIIRKTPEEALISNGETEAFVKINNPETIERWSSYGATTKVHPLDPAVKGDETYNGLTYGDAIKKQVAVSLRKATNEATFNFGDTGYKSVEDAIESILPKKQNPFAGGSSFDKDSSKWVMEALSSNFAKSNKKSYEEELGRVKNDIAQIHSKMLKTDNGSEIKMLHDKKLLLSKRQKEIEGKIK